TRRPRPRRGPTPKQESAMKRSALTTAALAFALAAALAAPLAAARAADTFKADAVHSSVVFRVKHMNTSYAWGRFNDLAGSFSLDPADPAKGKLQFTVK